MTTDEYLENCFCVAILDLGLSKDEFYDLTPYEFTALVDYNTSKQKSEYQVMRNTIYNAGVNLLRKKGEKEIPLFNEEDRNEAENKEKMKSEREALFNEVR